MSLLISFLRYGSEECAGIMSKSRQAQFAVRSCSCCISSFLLFVRSLHLSFPFVCSSVQLCGMSPKLRAGAMPEDKRKAIANMFNQYFDTLSQRSVLLLFLSSILCSLFILFLSLLSFLL
jgi:hypothetical protein